MLEPSIVSGSASAAEEPARQASVAPRIKTRRLNALSATCANRLLRDPYSTLVPAAVHKLALYYLSAVDTLVNVVFKLDPTPATATIMAIEIPAAMSPYSIAVAPVSLHKNCLMNALIWPAASVIGVTPKVAGYGGIEVALA